MHLFVYPIFYKPWLWFLKNWQEYPIPVLKHTSLTIIIETFLTLMSNIGVWIAFYLFLNTCMSIQHTVTENSSSLPHYNNSVSEGGNPAH